MRGKQIVLTLLCLSVAAQGFAAPPPMPSEQEITQRELGKGNYRALPIQRLVAFTYPLRYYFQNLEFQANVEASSRKSDVFTAGSAAAEVAAVTRASQIGWSRSLNDPTTNKFLGAAIALDVLGAVFGDKSDRDRLEESWRELRYPSLYFVSIRANAEGDAVRTSEKTAAPVREEEIQEGNGNEGPSEQQGQPLNVAQDDGVDAMFANGVALIRALNLGCEPARFKSTNIYGSFITRGEYLPGKLHGRMYLCGREGEVDVGVTEARVDSRLVLSQRIGASQPPTPFDNAVLGWVALQRIDKMSAAVALLDPGKNLDPEGYPRAAFERVKESMGDQWTAVFTERKPDGKRVVTVAGSGIEAQFDIPKQP